MRYVDSITTTWAFCGWTIFSGESEVAGKPHRCTNLESWDVVRRARREISANGPETRELLSALHKRIAYCSPGR